MKANELEKIDTRIRVNERLARENKRIGDMKGYSLCKTRARILEIKKSLVEEAIENEKQTSQILISRWNTYQWVRYSDK